MGILLLLSVSIYLVFIKDPFLLFAGNIRISFLHPEGYQYYAIFERRILKNVHMDRF
jgi:hypothetical protein